jgi:hypothetical protein
MAPRYLIGLDLGSAQDFSALSIIEERGYGREATYLCRHLQRWPLRTAYTEIVRDVAALVNHAELQQGGRNVLACDLNGPGAPVIDLLKTRPLSARLVAIFSHGGDRVTSEGDVMRVPKRELVSATQLALQSGRLKIAPALPEAQTLVMELQNYQVHINEATAHDSYGAWRQGQHDDLLFSVMLPVWCACGAASPDVTVFRRHFG